MITKGPMINLIQVFPVGISVSNTPERPVLIFKDKSEKHVLPVWLDHVDAGLVMADSSQKTRQSGVHHAVLKTFEAFGIKVEKVIFDEVVGHQQFVNVFFTQKKDVKEVRLRAAEAMSLCLKSGAEFFATVDVMDKSREIDMTLASMQIAMLQGYPMGAIPEHLKN